MSSRDSLLPIAAAHKFDEVGRYQIAQHLRHVAQLGFALPKANAVDKTSQPNSFFFTAAVIASQQFGQFLMEMEDCVCIAVLARHSVGPQFLHEKDLVGELWRNSCNKNQLFIIRA